MAVDPQLLAIWTRGWAMSRGLDPPARDRDAWRIEVGQPDQTRRFIYGDLGPDIERRGAEIEAPFVFLKVCAPPETVRPLLSPAWDVRQTGTHMVLDDVMPGRGQDDPGYRTDLWSHGAVRFCVLRDGNSAEAARGRAVRIEDRIIYDRIAVSPDHRRRGLGGRIMRTLQAEMGDWPLGVLVATEDGAALYATLGWRPISPYTTAVRL